MPSPSTRKARALLTYLVMHHGKDVAREKLLEIFWPDADPDRGRDSLRVALWAIRRALRSTALDADEFFLSDKSIVRWQADTTLDSERFLELARHADSQGQEEALQVYGGDFLEGDYDDWASRERERITEAYETLLSQIVRTSKNAAVAQQLVARNPYDEEAYAALIEAELEAGKRLSAKAYLERCRTALQEVGARPSASFEARFKDVALVETRASDELELPFTGREDEVSVLTTSLTSASDRAQRVILIHGDAGIGKSTLLQQVKKLAVDAGHHVVEASCIDQDSRIFGPWETVYKQVTGGNFDTFALNNAGGVAAKVAEAVCSSLPKPAVILVDDAHALRGEALDIFVELAERAPLHHLMVVSSRPEGVSTLRSRLNELETIEIPVGPLERRVLKAALSQAMREEHVELFETLYARTGGHPLFFSGLLRSLAQSGVIVRDGRRWKVVEKLNQHMELPDSLRRFIETRLRARGEDAHTTAGALAVEPGAAADDLVAVLGLGESKTFDALDDLLALGIITQPADGPEFAFAHDLLREVALATLNAGRRAAFHRAFARRLEQSQIRDAALRRARHLRASGQLITAGDSYARAARQALAWNAVQDAIERADEGILALEQIERTSERDRALAKLKSLVARASLTAAQPEAAIRSADEAVVFARGVGDAAQLGWALLDRASGNGIVYNAAGQGADAAEAAQIGRACADNALLATACVHQAASARALGNCADSLAAASEAFDMGARSGNWTVALAALEEQLSTQVTWWLFDGALETLAASEDAGRRAGALAYAGFLQSRASLWFVLERLEESAADLKRAINTASEARRHQETEVHGAIPLAQLGFTAAYMIGAIAASQSRWDQVLSTVREIADTANFSALSRSCDAVALLRIDGLLGRNLPDDARMASDIVQTLDVRDRVQTTLGWSDCPALALARVAARLHEPTSARLLERALNVIEENARRTPLEADRAFSKLAEAAEEAGSDKIRRRASARSNHLRTLRIAAAGTAWARAPLHPASHSQ